MEDKTAPHIDSERNISIIPITQGIDVYGFTPRLKIRSYNSSDYEASCPLYTDEELTEYFCNGKPMTPSEARDYLNERGRVYFDKSEPYGIFSVFLRNSDTFIGHVDVAPTKTAGELEIGWIFLKKFHGKGYCSEAILDFLIPLIKMASEKGFKALGKVVNRVFATAHPNNAASQKIISKAGLTYFKSEPRYQNSPREWYALDL